MRKAKAKHLGFAALCCLMIILFHSSLTVWLQLALNNGNFSHLWLIPLISAGLIYWDRERIFANVESSLSGVLLSVTGITLCVVAYSLSLLFRLSNELFVVVLAVLACWTLLFRLCYGRYAWWAARFPIFFLIFMVPIPAVLLDKLIYYLASGSASVVDLLFTLSHVPYLRSGMSFVLPGLQIEIAPECSGIRSSIALLIIVVLIAHFALRSWWRKLLLVASVAPLVFFKNGLRIVTLSLLAIKVDRGFITGPLHHRGGFVFFGLTLLIVILLCRMLQSSERRIQNSRSLAIPEGVLTQLNEGNSGVPAQAIAPKRS